MRLECQTPFGPGIIVDAGEYRDGSPALRIISANEDMPEPLCTLTVCMDIGPVLPAETFLIKTYSENAKTAHMLLEQGLFVDTGGRVDNGYVEAEVWKLNK